jgi:tungstate transport system ATP-binding protein
MRAPSILPLSLEGVGLERGGQTLLDDLSTQFHAGSRTVVLGPNGAGKSLLLRICHGLVAPSRGRVRWAGESAFSVAELGRRQAMVFQKPVLLRRSVLGNMTYALALAGVPWVGRRSLALAALDRFGLAGMAERPARVLSGGEQQRLALARAWARFPDILFLDEPTASLDPAATAQVEAAINQFHQAGTKLVMTTHDLGQARRLADQVLFLSGGRLLEDAPAATFFTRPATPQARAFLAGELEC